MDSDSSDTDENTLENTDSDDPEENGSCKIENTYLNAEQLEKISAFNYEETSDEENSNTASNTVKTKLLESKVPTSNRKILKLLHFIDNVLNNNQILRPSYQDVTPSFADEVPFLVDGDSLMITLMRDKNWSSQLGGSSLHLIYLFERYLNIFVKRGGAFHLVFFQNWRNIWHTNWNILLHRSIIINHFSKNIEKYPVHLFDNCFDENFVRLVSAVRPGFILTNMDAYDNCSEIFKVDKNLLKHVMNINLLNWLKMDLPCIDTNYIEVGVSIVNGYYLECNSSVRGIVNTHFNKFIYFITNLPKIEECMSLPDCIQIPEDYDIRTATFLITAYFFYKRNKDENMVKIFFLTAAMMELLELKNRCCPKFTASISELDKLVAEWHKCMFFALSILEKENYNWSTVCDLWQGILFGHVCRFVSSKIDSSEQLGSEVSPIYEKMVQDFISFGFSMNAYPITLPKSNINFKTIEFLRVSQKEPRPLLPIENPLVLNFCSSILHNIKWQDPPKRLVKKQYIEDHYHTMKVISDEHDHIRDTISKQPSDKWELKRYINGKHLQAKYMTLYGSSIEGRPLKTSGVIRNIKNPSYNKKKKFLKKSQDIIHDKKNITGRQEERNTENSAEYSQYSKCAKNNKKKTEKKSLQIIRDNQKNKMINQEKKNKEQLEEFKAEYKKHGVNLKTLLDQLDLMLINKTFCEGTYKIETMFLKLKILKSISKKNASSTKSEDLKKIEKSIFLTAREILNSDCDVSHKNKVLLSNCLCIINCTEIAKRNNLPLEIEQSPKDDEWIRFQLNELGPELIRETGGNPDSRVNGFIPDPWQSKLFDIVDKRQSALIVAPTSSGKTYASYYCMESVLREGTEGVVVYVAPTKALVNQVAATVYARFKDTNMPDGMSVYGVFTRDYRTHALTSQILVTVPQCLELLLLSPQRHSWVKRLRFVIFDEVHCIEGNLGGASFERCLLLISCPFLALSATIRNPDGLHQWLQKAENYKQCRDKIDCFNRDENSYEVHLVTHSDRHSDLTKFTFGNGKLHHLHPYAELEESVLRHHKGIPSHMTLSPAETMQLYDVMSKVYPESEDLKQLSPIMYFSSEPENGFISRNLARKYARELSKLLEYWFKNCTHYFEDTIKFLKPPAIDQIDGSGKVYIISKIAKLILHLKEQNMLPALIFAYNRTLIKDMTVIMTKCLENKITSAPKAKCIINKQTGNKPMLKSNTDRLEAKFNKKALSLYSGNANKTLSSITSNLDYTDRKLQRKAIRHERYEKPLNLISENAEQSLQGMGVITSDDIKFIEHRLRRACINSKHLIPRAMRTGICMHHGGLGNKVRSAVEMLFRKRLLNVVFATGTLALGIHMPCKTAVIAGNSAYLNSLEYHQMSGRAGRRGYDTSGNVVFLGLNPRKQHSLLTAKLPYLKGNFPITVTLILRTLLLVTNVTDNGKESEEATKQSISRVMAMFENSFCFMEDLDLKIQIKYFFSFTLQLLKMQNFINNKGEPMKWCGLAIHLHYHEPGNLAFVYLLKTGVIRKICTNTKNVEAIRYTLLTILSYLFTSVPLNAASKKKFNNSVVVLDPLPDMVSKALEQYNDQVRFVFNQYFVNVASYFNESDNVLPLSSVKIVGKNYKASCETENLQNKFLNMCVPKLVCSPFTALSGNDDTNAYSEDTLINNLKQNMLTDVKVIPLINLNVELNGYAVDFYRHGIVQSIINDNGIKSGAEFTLLTDFLLVLKTIRVSLEEMRFKDKNDVVYHYFSSLEKEYSVRHVKAFGRDHM